MATEATQMETSRGNRRKLSGRISANKMDKTVVVTVTRRVKHPLYGKYVVRKSRMKVHDPANECKIGDRIEIVETRPISKDKRWKVNRIIERAVEV